MEYQCQNEFLGHVQSQPAFAPPCPGRGTLPGLDAAAGCPDDGGWLHHHGTDDADPAALAANDDPQARGVGSVLRHARGESVGAACQPEKRPEGIALLRPTPME